MSTGAYACDQAENTFLTAKGHSAPAEGQWRTEPASATRRRKNSVG